MGIGSSKLISQTELRPVRSNGSVGFLLASTFQVIQAQVMVLNVWAQVVLFRKT